MGKCIFFLVAVLEVQDHLSFFASVHFTSLRFDSLFPIRFAFAFLLRFDFSVFVSFSLSPSLLSPLAPPHSLRFGGGVCLRPPLYRPGAPARDLGFLVLVWFSVRFFFVVVVFFSIPTPTVVVEGEC